MPEATVITRIRIPADGEAPESDDLAQLIGLRNADMRRVRGNDEHSLTVEQALPFWREQSDRRQVFHLARMGGAVVASGSVDLPLEPGDRTAGLNVRVAHERWGRGIGSAMLVHLEALAQRRAAPSRRHGRSIHRPRASASTPAPDWGPSRRITRRPSPARRGYALEQVVPQQLSRHPAEPRPRSGSCGRLPVRPLSPTTASYGGRSRRPMSASTTSRG